MSILDRVAGVATRPFTRDATVVAAVDLAPAFRRIDLRVGGKPAWAAGQKLQLRVQGVDFRTYTPFGWDGELVSILALTDGTGPGAAWARRVGPGDGVQAFGPRGAVDVASLAAPPVLIGDETSLALATTVGAVAGHLYEATEPDALAAVAEQLGLGDVDVVTRQADDTHHDELARRAVELVGAAGGAPLVLTGKAQSIRAVRGALADAGLRPATKVKAHWDPRRRGLD